ncbi:helix-turn-helix transcriptional regulator [Naumannella sp. ID2617S]|nr:helix-turn-helix transcriptional regulator [Naumannella sp. ID2617S]
MSIESQSGTVPVWHVGDRMRKGLEHAGVSVGQMADYLGVNRNSVGRWLSGRVSPGKQTLRLWAVRTGVPLSWLETGDAPAGGPDGGAADGAWYTARDSNPEPAD